MQPRIKLKSEEYWQEWLEDNDETIEMFQPLITAPDRTARDHLGFAYNVWKAWHHKTIAAYSAGYPVSDIEDFFNSSLNATQVFADLYQKNGSYARESYSAATPGILPDLSFFVLFDTDERIVDRYMTIYKNEDENNGIQDHFINVLGWQKRHFDPNNLAWPELFENLYKVFTVPAMQRPQQLKEYVDHWYAEIGKEDVYWHDNHKSKHDSYFGYWCFEAAGVAKILEIDDRNLKDHPHYPFDLRHYKPQNTTHID